MFFIHPFCLLKYREIVQLLNAHIFIETKIILTVFTS